MKPDCKSRAHAFGLIASVRGGSRADARIGRWVSRKGSMETRALLTRSDSAGLCEEYYAERCGRAGPLAELNGLPRGRAVHSRFRTGV
jgi:hypothetical protein